MLTILALEPLAAPPKTGLLKSIAQVLLFSGIGTVCVAFPPLRKKFVAAAQSVRDYFYQPATLPRPAQQVVEPSKNSRREIEEFDLDLFT